MTHIPYVDYLNLKYGFGIRQIIYQKTPPKKTRRTKIGEIIPQRPDSFRNEKEFIQVISLINEEDLSEAFPFLEKRLKNRRAFINSFSSIADIIFYELFPGWKEKYMLWSGDISNGDLKGHTTAKQVLIYKDIFRFALEHAQTEKRMGWSKWRQKIFIQYLQETDNVNTDMILAMEGRLNTQSHANLMEYEKTFIETWQSLELQKTFSFSIVGRPTDSRFKETPWGNLKIKHSWEE